MIYTNKEYCLEVKGSMACFTRPEMKVERVSYDIITPSAARAIFESIFWKPAIQWNITRIEVLNPIRWFSMKRNEIGSLMSPRSSGLFIEDNRQQKSSLLLKDVCYRIFAELEFIPIRNRAKEDMLKVPSKSSDENPGKYNAMFERRAKKGQCFNQPYLGCREFSADFTYIENPVKGNGIETNTILWGLTTLTVVPYIGTWIETVDNRYACPSESVVPYIGTCIGQKLIHVS